MDDWGTYPYDFKETSSHGMYIMYPNGWFILWEDPTVDEDLHRGSPNYDFKESSTNGMEFLDFQQQTFVLKYCAKKVCAGLYSKDHKTRICGISENRLQKGSSNADLSS